MKGYRLWRRKGNWTVERKHVHTEASSTPGKVEWKPESWHGHDLESACRRLLEFEVIDPTLPRGDTPRALIAAIQDAEEIVREEIRNLPTRIKEL